MNYYLKVVINSEDENNICSLMFGTLDDQVWTLDGSNIHYMKNGVVNKEYNDITTEREGIFKKIIIPINEKELTDIIEHPYKTKKIIKKSEIIEGSEDTIKRLIHEYSKIKGKEESELT